MGGSEDVLVLYEDVDENLELEENFEEPLCGPEPNAFILQVDRSQPVRMIDLKRGFPLSRLDNDADFIFRVQTEKGHFEDLVNPASPVPRVGPNGSIVCKILRSPLPLPPPTEAQVTATLQSPLPPNYFAYKKHQKPHGIINPESSSSSSRVRKPSMRSPINEQTFIKQEQIEETVEAVKQGARKVQELGKKVTASISTIDEEKIKKATRDGMKKLGSGMKGLWNNLKSTTESFVQNASSQVQASLTVGRYDIRIQTLVAEGGFSMVYLCKDETPNSPTFSQPLALKKMICQTRESRSDANTEIKLLRACSHPNIITLLDSSSVDVEGAQRGTKEFYLLFPFIEKSAYDIIATNITKSRGYKYEDVNTYAPPYSEIDALEVLLGCCSALSYFHTELLVSHRDFKPHNVLLRFDGGGFMGGPTAVVMDVGSAARANVEVKNRTEAINLEEEAGTKCSAPYRAPELFEVRVGSVVGVATDIWSLGCTMFALAFGYCPFETPKEGVMKLAILNGNWKFPRSGSVNEFSEGYKSLIEKLLSREPEDRGTAKEAAEEIKLLLQVFR
ncbi:hypothetical protein TrST_g12241 [Triparma strigata]|uniref:Protein kinase domain-containing protein n=1 Tax=Triparma strigata TaxID=1606541 RepID=A0A9W7ER94_9STRA|nr:hypothetical protein TrST_g12241 [Triparma strigata]